MGIAGTALVKLVHEGALAQGEQFAWGLWLKPATGALPTLDATQTWLNGVATRLIATECNSSTSGAFTSLIAEDSSYSTVRGYIYPAGADVASGVVEATVNKSGTGAAELPDQCSLVASLRSTVPSRSGRGRVYLPANGVGLAVHQMFSTDLGNLATVMKNYLDFLNTSAIAGDELDVVVRSVTQGVVRLVHQVVIDSRLDIQRRRANSQAVLFTQVKTLA